MIKNILFSFMIVFFAVISLSFAGENNAKLGQMCKVMAEENIESIGDGKWLRAEGTFSRYNNLTTIKYRSLSIPVFGGEIVSVDDQLRSKFRALKLEFSDSTTEIRLVPNDDSYIFSVSEERSKISKQESNKLNEFIEKKTFREKLAKYSSELINLDNCRSDFLSDWSKIYMEGILASVASGLADGDEAQIFSDGIIYDVEGGIEFISITPDRKYILRSVSYRS